MANAPRRRAPSPIRRTVLDDIPEASPPQAVSTNAGRLETSPGSNALPTRARVVTPGPNAFALHAAEVDSHRLRSNAFYQQATAAENARRQAAQDQEMAGLELTPPTAVHPALRGNFCLGDSSPHTNLMANQMAVKKAKSPLFKSGHTPPLKLIPEEGSQGNPTDRNFIEGFHEELEPKDSANETGRTPVFKYTPKLRSSEFGKSVGPATPQKKKGGVFNWAANGEQPSSPKKGLFEKLRLTSARTPQAPNPTSPFTIMRGDGGGEALPPKAKAVLSTTPQKTGLGRSPSKTLGKFARKASDAVFSLEMTKARRSLGSEQQATSNSTRRVNFSASVGSKTPARELRPKVKRITSQPQPQLYLRQDEDRLADPADISGVIRGQSLQYFDRQNPPTPPAKNTPPHEKKLRAEQEEANRILEAHKARSENQAEIINKMSQRKPVTAITPKREMQQKPESKLTSPLHNKVFMDDTPTRETLKLVGADGRTSPTKYGTYAHKNLPTIVKAPSFYSMSGSYFPGSHEDQSFEEVKKCADGLGLDGLRDIPENYYKGDFNIVHSPSIYEDDWSTNVGLSTKASSDTLHVTGMFKPSPSMPDVLEHVRQLPSPAVPVSAPQARQLSSKISIPTMESPSITARASSRSSSKGSIPLVYPGLASDPSRMNLLEDLNNRRGSAPGTRRPSYPRPSTRDGNFDALMDLSEESDTDDLPQLSPDAYSHPSAKPSPLYSPSSATFSPVVPNTPPRKGNNEALSASPSPHKTLTPSRSRGRIETYKQNTGSPIARDADSFPVESQTLQLPPSQLNAVTPTIAVTPPAASPAVFLGKPEKVELVRYPAEKPLIPLSPAVASTGAVQSDPQKVDSVKPSAFYDANNLMPSSEIVDYTSFFGKHRQVVRDHDNDLADPVVEPKKPVKQIPSWFNEVMPNYIDGKESTEKVLSDSTSEQATSAKEKHPSDASEEVSDDEEEIPSWRRVADQYAAQIAFLKAELAKFSASNTQEDELVELRNTVCALQQQTAGQQQQGLTPTTAPTSASSNVDTVRQYLASGADTELEHTEHGSLRSVGLRAEMQQKRVEPAMRESERVLRRRFESSAEAQREFKANKDFVGEGESKEDSLAQVLAAIGGLSQRIEAMEKKEKKKGGQ